MEKEVPNVNDQHEVPEVVSTEKEQADQFESPSEEEEDLLPTSTSNVPNLNDRSLFSVGRSSRFGRSVKINSKFLS